MSHNRIKKHSRSQIRTPDSNPYLTRFQEILTAGKQDFRTVDQIVIDLKNEEETDRRDFAVFLLYLTAIKTRGPEQQLGAFLIYRLLGEELLTDPVFEEGQPRWLEILFEERDLIQSLREMDFGLVFFDPSWRSGGTMETGPEVTRRFQRLAESDLGETPKWVG